ncbi:hypothetical protein ACOQFO_06900 [Ureibacillus sp. MALMAid1270]|uniref:hypothetical protein n=1 Tax=Ureibacillus sp. MALMAid1270 TaxID=3411629 RepID=UPI003BA48ED9
MRNVYFTTFLLSIGMFLLISQSASAEYRVLGTIDDYSNISDENKGKAKNIIENLKEQLNKLGIENGHSDIFENLDEEIKEKAKEIMKQAKEGSISREAAKKQLSELGVDLPDKKQQLLKGLDEETKTKAKEIFKQLREGKITKEEAHTKLGELGITLPKHDELENLDPETKEKVAELVEDARTKLEQLGLKLPKRFEKFLNISE